MNRIGEDYDLERICAFFQRLIDWLK